MRTRFIAGRPVSAIGLGGAGFSVPDAMAPEDIRATIHAALDGGVRLIDTATCYVPGREHQGHNECSIMEALRSWTGNADEVLVASKAGIKRVASIPLHVDFAANFESSGRPEVIRAHCEASLVALGVETIDLYQLHSPDPAVPIEETMGAFSALQREGKIALVGVCNVDLELLERARTAADIVTVQNRYNPADLTSEAVHRRCEELGIAFLAYSPLGGLGNGARGMPDRVPGLGAVAEARGITPHQAALAWELAQSPVVIPIPGCRRPETATSSAAAADIELSPDEVAAIGVAVPA